MKASRIISYVASGILAVASSLCVAATLAKVNGNTEYDVIVVNNNGQWLSGSMVPESDDPSYVQKLPSVAYGGAKPGSIPAKAGSFKYVLEDTAKGCFFNVTVNSSNSDIEVQVSPVGGVGNNQCSSSIANNQIMLQVAAGS